MNIKRFIASSNQEAIQMVKKEMGSEAIILRTRTLDSPGPYSERSGQRIEVTAAVDYEVPDITTSTESQLNSLSVMKKWQQMEMELKEIKDAIFSADAGAILMPELYFNRELKTRYINYKTFGLRADIIRRLMNESHGKEEIRGRSATHLLQDSLSKVLRKINIDGNSKKNGGRKYTLS